MPFDATFHFQGATFTSFNFVFPDFSPSSAVCWEPYNRTGQHQKTQVYPLAPCDEVFALWLLVCDSARVFSSLPMFTVLRKFTILMTMILEVYILRLDTSDLTILPVTLKHFDLILMSYFPGKDSLNAWFIV